MKLREYTMALSDTFIATVLRIGIDARIISPNAQVIREFDKYTENQPLEIYVQEINGTNVFADDFTPETDLHEDDIWPVIGRVTIANPQGIVALEPDRCHAKTPPPFGKIVSGCTKNGKLESMSSPVFL